MKKMKVFMSCDIEGTALTNLWEECYPQTMSTSVIAGRQHAAEVKAACEGAIAAGATEIVIRDAHNTGTHLDITDLPSCVKVIRGWTGDPMGMAYGVDSSFDAAIFIGYHSAAGRCGNPLSHTETRELVWLRMNGRKCSEFQIYSWAAALHGVPTVFLSGDQMLIDDTADLHPSLITAAVKEGFGGMTMCLHPEAACNLIREGVARGLKQDLTKALCTMPDEFTVEICYKEVKTAVAMSFFPGFEMVDDNTIRMHTTDYMELLRALQFVL